MSYVFISYARKDGREVADYLYEKFNKMNGWSAWMDKPEIRPEEIFGVEIGRAIQKSDCVVAVLSPDVERGGKPSFVQQELHYARQELVDKPVFAVRAEKCVVPVIIAGITYIDFFPDSRFEEAFQELLQSIKRGQSAYSVGTIRDNELAYLREVARKYSFFGKVYVDPAAEAPVRPTPQPTAVVTDPDVDTYLDTLLAAVHPPKQHSPDESSRDVEVQDFDALTEAIGEFERVAIIGEPGSGKTTTLRRFAYALAEAAAEDETQPLPIFVPLGGYTGGDVGAYIQQHFGELPLAHYLSERVVVLFDGLNETAQANVEQIEGWLDAHPDVRVLLTCRTLDYVERELQLQRVDVLPLDIPRILRFMDAYKLSETARNQLFWGLAPEPVRNIWRIWQREDRSFEDFWFGGSRADTTTTQQDDHLNIIRQDAQQGHYPGLLDLARNPFLLTIIIALFKQHGEVPRNRGQLFGDFVSHLFKQRGQRAAETMQIDWLASEEQIQALKHLAYRMQAEKSATRVPYAWARGVVAEALPARDPDHVLYLTATSGLLEKGEQIAFTHQLLQEYFQALRLQELMDEHPASEFWPVASWWEASGWEETVLFLAGLHSTDCTPVIEWVREAQPELALRCAAESGADTPAETVQQLQTYCIQRMTDPEREPEPPARALIGRRLGYLKWDSRPGVGVKNGLPDIDWVEITNEGKPWTYQGEQHDPLPTFYMARYPITYWQFQAFMEAEDGWPDDQWWDGLAADADDRQPADQWFKVWNHPRDQVSWYGAMAFCRWLSFKLTGEVPDIEKPLEWPVRLPTEQEWEKAARGTDGRIYPWGDEFVQAYANTSHDIGQTTAVGLYPQGASPYELMDMSGNVFEWTLTEYQNGQSDDITNGNRRVRRGGSWSYGQDRARAAYRNGAQPYSRHLFGFRLVVRRPPQPTGH